MIAYFKDSLVQFGLHLLYWSPTGLKYCFLKEFALSRRWHFPSGYIRVIHVSLHDPWNIVLLWKKIRCFSSQSVEQGDDVALQFLARLHVSIERKPNHYPDWLSLFVFVTSPLPLQVLNSRLQINSGPVCSSLPFKSRVQLTCSHSSPLSFLLWLQCPS